MNKMNKMKIDDQIVEFEDGDTILQAARKADIYIPTLCYVEGLTPYGGCRLCTIRIIGARKPFATACSAPATPDMEVITKDNELQELRKDVLQVILSEHPNGCLVCSHGEKCSDLAGNPDEIETNGIFGCFSCPNKMKCELRVIFTYLGINELQYGLNYKNREVERYDPFFERDYNLCVLCGRCVNICSELRGIDAIQFMNRGANRLVSTANNISHLDSSCIFCGSCLDVCPTGVHKNLNAAWIEKVKKYTQSTCALCNVGCTFNYFEKDGVFIDGSPEGGVTDGQACVIGRFCAPEFIESKSRLIEPLVKSGSNLIKSSWGKAYKTIKDKLSEYKPEEIAVLASPDLSNESAYLLNKFATDVLKTKNIATITDGNSMDYYRELTAIPRNFSNIDKSDWVILINANIQISHQTMLIPLKKAYDKGAKIYSLSFGKNKIPNETGKLLTEDLNLAKEEIPQKILDLSGIGGKGTIIIGQQTTDNIIVASINAAIGNKKISVIPLRGRSNIEGVYNYIPQSEDEILNKIKKGNIKALFTTERIDLDLSKKLKFLVIQDIFSSETSNIADVVLPSSSYIEDSGTIVNAELKSQKFNKVTNSKGNSKIDSQIIMELAERINESELTMDNSKFVKESMKNLKNIELMSKNDIIGVKFNINSFKYRGELISNKVADLRRLISHKMPELSSKLIDSKTSDDKIKSETTFKESEIRQDVIIDINGVVKIGNTQYDLQDILTIFHAAKITNNRLNVVVETENNDKVLLVDGNGFCICNNYKNLLTESQSLMEINESYCNIYVKVKNGSEESVLKLVKSVIIVQKDFATLEESELIKNKEILLDFTNKDKKRMYLRALERGRNLLQKKELYFGTNIQDISSLIKEVAEPEVLRKEIIQIDEIQCIACGACVEACNYEAILLQETAKMYPTGKKMITHAVHNPKLCQTCGFCVEVCPVGAATIMTLEDMAEKIIPIRDCVCKEEKIEKAPSKPIIMQRKETKKEVKPKEETKKEVKPKEELIKEVKIEKKVKKQKSKKKTKKNKSKKKNKLVIQLS